MYSFSIDAMMSDHKFNSSKWHSFISSQLLWVRYMGTVQSCWVFCLEPHKKKIKVSAWLHSLLEILGKNLLQIYPGYWQNSISWSCRTGVLFLCGVSAGRPLPPRGTALILARDSLHLRTSNSAPNLSHTWNFSDFFCCIFLASSWRKFPAFTEAWD